MAVVAHTKTLVGRLKQAAVLGTMSVTALNVYTGSPLLGLWVGSRVQGDGPPSMGAIFVMLSVFLGTSLLLVRILAALGRLYDRLVGRPPQTRRHTPWLRSLRGDRPREVGAAGYELGALDYLMVGSVIVLAVAFEIWFFFYSSSPIDGRSGRPGGR
jgi:hypothetical protein